MLKNKQAHRPDPEVVLYHGDCTDGFGAAWALWKQFPKAQFLAVKHGHPPPQGLRNRHVVMVDFSYGRETIEALAKTCAGLQILDHHVTAQSALSDLSYACFDMTKSGAVMAWEWAHHDPVPWLLRYIQDKDLWQWQLPASREINAALASYPFDFQVWDSLRQETLEVEGRAILRYENIMVDKLVEEAVLVSMNGEMVPAVYCPILTSQIGERLSQDHPFCLIWHQRDGRRYVSLRSKAGGVSVGNIATQYGGGGHTHAAGFSMVLNAGGKTSLNPIVDLPSSHNESSPTE